MPNPVFLRYVNNVLYLDGHDVFTTRLNQGKMESKNAFGWLFGSLQKLYYRVRYSPQQFETIRNNKFRELFRENAGLLNPGPAVPAPQGLDVRLHPVHLTRLARVADVTKKFRDIFPFDNYQDGLVNWINSDMDQQPAYVRQFIQDYVDSGLTGFEIDHFKDADLSALRYENPEKMALLIRCMDLKEKIDRFNVAFTKNFDRFSPYMVQEPTIDPVTNRYPCHLNEDKFKDAQGNLVNHELKTEVENFLLVFNDLPHPLFVRVLEIAQAAKNDDFIASLPSKRADFERLCARRNPPVPETVLVLDEEREVRPTKEQFKIACDLGNEVFRGLPALDSPNSRAFFARYIQRILVDDAVFRTLKWPVDDHQFAIQGLSEIESERDNVGEECFLDWFFTYVNPAKLDNSFKGNAVQRNQVQLSTSVGQFFKDITRSQDQRFKVGEELFPVYTSDGFTTFLKAFRNNFIEKYRNPPDYLRAGHYLKAFENRLGGRLEENVVRTLIEKGVEGVPLAQPFAQLLMSNLTVSSNEEANRLWRAYLLHMICFCQQTTAFPLAERLNAANSDPSLKLQQAFQTVIGPQDATFKVIFEFDKGAFAVKTRTAYSGVRDQLVPQLHLQGNPDVRSDRWLPVVWMTTELRCPNFMALVDDKNAPNSSIKFFTNPKVSPYMADHLDALIEGLSA